MDNKERKGSVLITTFVLMFGMVICLASYFKLSDATLKESYRNYLYTECGNLVEYGLESAIYELNTQEDRMASWDDWTQMTISESLTQYRRFSVPVDGAQGIVDVLVYNLSSAPTVTVRATVTLNSITVTRYGKVVLQGRSLFANGLLARNSITASGGSWFDSWESDPDNDASTAPIPYTSSVAQDNCIVATASTAEPAISIGSADIYGSVSVGADSYAGLSVSWGGQVGPRDMPISGPYNVAEGAFTPNFTATFEDVTAPTDTEPADPYQLPYTKRVVVSNQWSSWTENRYINSETLGEDDTETKLRLLSLTVDGDGTLTIKGDVTLVLTSYSEAMKIVGSGEIVLADDASLTIYVEGDVEIAGAGVLNTGAPEDFQLWSTSTTPDSQEIDILGSGTLSGIIYAPNSHLNVPGGTNLYGAAVVGSATFSGSGAFHYDESLKNKGFGGSSMEISSYSELTDADEREAVKNRFLAL